MSKFDYIVSTFFGTGNFPVAPGTFATLITALLYYFLVPVGLYDTLSATLIVIIILIVLQFPLAFIIKRVEKKLGEDSSKIVIDEVIGYIIAVMLLPKTLLVLILGFVFFRIFDILKPEPVNVIQKVKNGWGVLLDDILAGIYANIVIRIILKFI